MGDLLVNRINPNPFFDFLFRDPVRLVELFSAFNLLAWSYVIGTVDGILERDSYVAFSTLSASTWAMIFFAAATFQLLATFISYETRSLLRFVAMAISSGCWAVVTVSFYAAGVGTTANINYLLITLSCMASGGYLAWRY